MKRRCRNLWFSVMLFIVATAFGLPATAFSALNPQYGYVTDTFFSQIYIIDLTSNQVVGEPIAAGDNANLATHGVIVSPDGEKVYVANENGQSVSEITLVDKTKTVDDVVKVIPISGDYTGGIAVSPNGRYLYVAHIPIGYPFRSVLTVIDTDPPVGATEEFPVVTSITLEDLTLANQPFDIKVSPDGTQLYVSNKQANAVYVVDTNPVTGAVELATKIPVGNDPHGLAVSADSQLLYVANTGDNTISVVDPTWPDPDTAEIDVINVGQLPWRIVASPVDASVLYVTNSGENTVSVIRKTDTGYSVTPVTVGQAAAPRPRGIDINTDGTMVYVTNSLEDTLSIIDTTNSNAVTTFEVTQTANNLQAIAAEQEPHGVISVARDVNVRNTIVGGALAVPQKVFVYNVGVDNLQINTIASPNPPFSIVGDTCSGSMVPPEASCFFEIQFEPTVNSTFEEGMVIDTDFFDATVTLHGIGVSSENNLPPTVPRLIAPKDNATLDSTTVNFSWYESTDPNGDPVTYTVHIMPYTQYLDNGFDGSERIEYAAAIVLQDANILYAGVGLSSLLLLGGALRSRRHKALLVLLVTAATLTLVACGGGGGGGDKGSSGPQPVYKDVTGLEANETYVWKVVAHDTQGGETSSNAINLFRISNTAN